MYIKDIAIGSEDNLKDMMLGVLDLDSGVFPAATPTYPDNDNRAIRLRISGRQMTDDADYIGLGNPFDPQYAIIPTKIDYNNSSLGSGTSMPQTEYTEVDITQADPPDNWDLDRWQYYYVLRSDGSNNKHYALIPPASDWTTLRQDLMANNQKLYYNTDQAKWVWIGSGDKKMLFMVGRHGGYAGNTGNARPSACVFTRNCAPVSGDMGYRTGGYIRLGSTPESDAALPQNTANAFNANACDTIFNNNIQGAFTSGRYSTNAQYDNPICDCTLLQFGILKYNQKSYFGVYRQSYEPKYYWGYPLASGTSWSYARLDFDSPSDYTGVMDRLKTTATTTYPIEFYGICLDDFDIEIDTREGEIPPEEDPDGSFDYPTFTHRFMDDASFGILAPAASAGLHVYRLTASAFSKLASQIWSWGNIVNNVISAIEDKGLFSGAIDAVTSSIQQSRLSPSDCVVFARKMPYAVTNPPAGTLDIGFNLRLGGEYLDIIGDAYRRERICRTVVLDWSFTGPTQTFFDYSEYVGVSLYLPFIGSVSLPADCLMDGSMAINYAFDVISGQCTAMVITRSHDGRDYTHGPYTGDPSVNIPLAVADSNIMGRQLATAKAAVNGIKGAVSGFAKGGLIGKGGAAASLIGAAGQIAEAQAAPAGFTSVTDLGSNTAICSPTDLMVQLTYPATVDLINTINLVGASAYRTGRISDYVSETGDNFAQFSFVDLSGIPATDTELAELESQLRQGVHL